MTRMQSSIGSYPADWNIVVLETVAELRHGYQFRTYDFTKEGIKVFKITQIKSDGIIDISNCDYIENSRLKNFEKFIIKKGDILMALSGATIGKIARYNLDEVILQNYRVGNFSPTDKNKLSKDYFYYFLSSEYGYQQIIANQTQSAQENVGKEDIHKMLLFLPPISEQIIIANILNSLDDKIDLLHCQNKTLEQVAETLFRQWFVEEAEESWDVGKLGDVIDLFDSKRVPLSSLERDKMKVGKLYPYYGAATIMDYVNDYIFDGEYILMGEDGTVQTEKGFPILQMPVGKFWVNNHTHIFRAKKPYSNFLIYIFLKGTNISNIVTGAVQPKINQEMLKSIDFPLPPIEKIEPYISIADDLWNKIKNNIIQISTLTQLRDELLPKLMSGEVRVKK